MAVVTSDRTGYGYMVFDIEDPGATRSQIMGEALEAWVDVCAREGFLPVGKPVWEFTPGECPTVRIETVIRPAARTWVGAVLNQRRS